MKKSKETVRDIPRIKEAIAAGASNLCETSSGAGLGETARVKKSSVSNERKGRDGGAARDERRVSREAARSADDRDRDRRVMTSERSGDGKVADASGQQTTDIERASAKRSAGEGVTAAENLENSVDPRPSAWATLAAIFAKPLPSLLVK